MGPSDRWVQTTWRAPGPTLAWLQGSSVLYSKSQAPALPRADAPVAPHIAGTWQEVGIGGAAAAVPGHPPVGSGVSDAMGARAVDVEGAGAVGSLLMATVATGALGTGSFRDPLMPGERGDMRESMGSWRVWATQTSNSDPTEGTRGPARPSFLRCPPRPRVSQQGAAWVGCGPKEPSGGRQCPPKAFLRFGTCHQLAVGRCQSPLADTWTRWPYLPGCED